MSKIALRDALTYEQDIMTNNGWRYTKVNGEYFRWRSGDKSRTFKKVSGDLKISGGYYL